MPVNHSPKNKSQNKTTVGPSAVNQLQLYAYSSTSSPKRTKRSSEVITDSDTEFDETITNAEIIDDPSKTMDLLRGIYNHVKNLTKDVSSIKNKLDEHLQCCNTENINSLTTAMKNLETKLQSVKNLPLNSTNQINREDYNNDRKKRKEVPEWESLHFKRRDAYYACHRAEKEKEHLNKFINENPIYIPKKYRPKPLEGESAKRYKIREKRSIGCMEIDIELRNDTIACKTEEYRKFDAEIISKIETFTSEEGKRNELKELWKKEVEAAAERGKEYWIEKKEPWWNNLKNKEPYLGHQPEFKADSEDVNEEIDTDDHMETTHTESSNNPTGQNSNNTDDGFTEVRHRRHTQRKQWKPIRPRSQSQNSTTYRRDNRGQHFLQRSVQFNHPK